ncbi:sulfurtransferase TusA family protein [Protofrankia symbiont of Coriaria ruscifolia]|uniref:sulfurtransferase TusA family protein n=1 Tax=Protofrankia symbiont of Coriaria ruscifolia TaxID=1306542 RepID=UPI001041A75D|nr:sulfurtransferase TusA family protein [Protofrankia symbiont of Coriaria ruscifolia]
MRTDDVAGGSDRDTRWDAAKFTVDARGRRCPLPIIELARHIGEIDLGATLALWADDPAADLDVPAWCRMRSQELVMTRALPIGGTAYLVRRLT